MANKPSENEIIEVLAFEQYVSAQYRAYSTPREQCVLNWQQSPETRQEWRNEAVALRIELQQRGLAIRVSSTPSVRKSLKEIMTQPETRAYSLDSEKFGEG